MSKAGRSIKRALGIGGKRKSHNPDLLDKKEATKQVMDIEGNLYGSLGEIIDGRVKELNKKITSTKSKKEFHKFFNNTQKSFLRKMDQAIKKYHNL